VYQSNIRRQFKLALHVILLTLIRKSMLLLATWDEFDFESGEWTIPNEHMKGKKGEEHEHVVYMSTQVAAMFREPKALAGNSQFVLAGRSSPKKPFAENALNHALEGLSFDMEQFTIHDLRRTASTELVASSHSTRWPWNVISVRASPVAAAALFCSTRELALFFCGFAATQRRGCRDTVLSLRKVIPIGYGHGTFSLAVTGFAFPKIPAFPCAGCIPRLVPVANPFLDFMVVPPHRTSPDTFFRGRGSGH
jgi:hypothetical protein